MSQEFLTIACLVFLGALTLIYVDGALSAIKTRLMIEELIRRSKRKTKRTPKWIKMKK